MSKRSLFGLLAVSAVLLTAAESRGQASRDRRPVPIRADAPKGALTAELRSPGQAGGQAVVTPLSAEATAALLERLEPLPDLSSANAKAPVLRAPSAAPLRAGATQPIAFAIPAGKPVARGTIAPAPPQKIEKALVAPQISPQGEIFRESEVRIRFDEAMVPVAEVGLVKQPPATITPNVPGTWRWLDSRVLLFTAEKRFPGSTEFVVTVPAGTKALSGAKLAEDVSARFQTTPVRVSSRFPSRILPTSPFMVTFDQEIDVDRILPFLQVEDARGKRLSWKRVSLADAELVWQGKPVFDAGTAVIIAPTTAWPVGTTIAAVLKKDAPSREGPRTTTMSSSIRTDVVAPFKVLGVRCDYRNPSHLDGAVCPADGSLSVEFSNPIDPKSYRSGKVQIAGEAFQDQSPNGTSVDLGTPHAVGREYAITIGDDLKDVYGQPLTGSRRVSFTTGPQRYRSYVAVPEGLQVLDPRFQIPQWVIHAEAVNSLRVQLYQVEPKDYFAYQDFLNKKRTAPPGRRVFDRQFVVGARHGADVRVDLRPALKKGGVGHVIAVATTSPLYKPNDYQDDFNPVAWIQVTKLGISARIDKEKLNGWVQEISPDTLLAPIGGATVSLLAPHRGIKATAQSDAEGHAAFELPLPDGSPMELPRKPALLVAEAQGDSTFVEVSSFERTIRRENALWYVTDDRFLYKPGETVYLKGWLRWTHDGVNPNLALPAPGEEVSYTLHDAHGVKIASGTSKTSETGGFDLEVKLPPNVNLGYASFELVSRKSHHEHPISIQEFRAPAFAVTLNDDVTHAGTAPLVLGESIEMSASAKYYAGGGLTGAQIIWKATLTAASYSPPGWPLFSFASPHTEDGRGKIEMEKQDVLGAASSAEVLWGISALHGGYPSVLKVDATITDLDRMTIMASSRPILVHPSAFCVGARAKIAPEGGEVIELVVTNVDGKPVADVPVDVKIEGVLNSERYRNDAKVVDTQTCRPRSATVPVTCPFKPINRDTAYTATATVVDQRGRRNTTVYHLPWFASADHKSDFEVRPDKRSYRVGDTAKIEIYSTLLPATAIVSFARQGVIAQKRVELTKPSTFVELPIDPGYLENVFVVVDRYAPRPQAERDQKKKRPPLPTHQALEVELTIDTAGARLTTTVRPTQSLVEPGEPATFEALVEHDGKPVANAEVALLAVDEAILALSGKSHADPLAPFYRRVNEGTSHYTSIDNVRDAGDDLDGEPGANRYRLGVVLTGFGTGGGGTGEGTSSLSYGRSMGSTTVKARKDFRANAAFSPRLKTDAHGRVRLTVTMPDSLSRFRIVALASSGTYFFGKGENVIVTQRKLNARTIAPRFLSQGDKFSLPVLVQNLDSRPRTVDVAVRAANLVAVGPAGKRVTIPGGQRAEVRFDFGSQARGQAVVQTIATSGDFADASNVEFPVYEPATTEAFATYGTVDDGAKFEQLQVPRDLFQDVGGVEVTLASTELQALTDAYWYLYAYPYECAEQRSSRMLATSAVYDILDAFATPGRPTRKEIDDTRTRDVRALTKDQRPDGGWGYFPGMKSDPFVTMQVVQALVAAHQATSALGRASGYVRAQWNTIISELQKADSATPARRPDSSRLSYLVSLASSTLGTLAASGEDVLARAETLHKHAVRLGAYPMDAQARLLSLVAKVERAKPMRTELLAHIVSATHETAAAATVTTSYTDGERLLLVSNHKTSALALDALLREAPEHPLVIKVARGILAGRRYGRWGSTQENLVVLQALRRYFDTFEKETPNYTGKLWVGQVAYAEQAFVGRSNLRGQVSLDWNSLVPGSTHDLALAKEGAGRMYYRVGITYAPKATLVPALDAGFVVRRTYSAVDAQSDVSKLADGRWKIRLGAKVLVTVETSNTSLRSNVAVVDPLPAGFETVNEALATSERTVYAERDDYWDYTNLRDNRSEVFVTSLPEGSHRFSYTVRATTPGTFIAAPAKAEEMYSPETFGRSDGEIVEIAEP